MHGLRRYRCLSGLTAFGRKPWRSNGRMWSGAAILGRQFPIAYYASPATALRPISALEGHLDFLKADGPLKSRRRLGRGGKRWRSVWYDHVPTQRRSRMPASARRHVSVGLFVKGGRFRRQLGYSEPCPRMARITCNETATRWRRIPVDGKEALYSRYILMDTTSQCGIRNKSGWTGFWVGNERRYDSGQ